MDVKSSSDVEVEVAKSEGSSSLPATPSRGLASQGEDNKNYNHEAANGNLEEAEKDDASIAGVKGNDGDVPKKAKRRRSSKKSVTSNAVLRPKESNYVTVPEDFCATKGEHSEELEDAHKSLLWFLIKQVRPGMDLSRVILPTFILEPRSFLDKLSDHYYHADYLTRYDPYDTFNYFGGNRAAGETDSLLRMKSVVRWYLSGFYKKPKGLKKPYNPILGETFRCMWTHPNGSRTFYVAEQVSHQPPVSAFYVSNRKDGFVITASITSRSKFYGNSSSAILEGVAHLLLIPHRETYVMTMPYVHCKGILLGTLSMELGGRVHIVCLESGYSAELEFMLSSFLSRGDHTNRISGKIKFGTETLLTIDGHWDSKITLKDKGSKIVDTLWEVTDEVKAARLPRSTIPIEEQSEKESEKLWAKVSEAIGRDDQEAATVEKTSLEERQQNEAEERKTQNTEWTPLYFKKEGTEWRYQHEDPRAWDDKNDISEYENEYVIATQRKRDTEPTYALVSMRTQQLSQYDLLRGGSSDQIVPECHQRASNRQLVDLLRHLLTRQMEQSEEIEQLKEAVADIQRKIATPKQEDPFRMTNTIFVVVFGVALQLLAIIFWFGDGKLIPVPRKPF